MSENEPPRPSPRPPDDSAPLKHPKTPAGGIPDIALMKRKIAEAEGRLVERMAATDIGKPRIPARWVPFLYVGLTACGAITTALIGDPTIPPWVLKVAAVGTLTFGGLLAGSPGWRKGGK